MFSPFPIVYQEKCFFSPSEILSLWTLSWFLQPCTSTVGQTQDSSVSMELKNIKYFHQNKPNEFEKGKMTPLKRPQISYSSLECVWNCMSMVCKNFMTLKFSRFFWQLACKTSFWFWAIFRFCAYIPRRVCTFYVYLLRRTCCLEKNIWYSIHVHVIWFWYGMSKRRLQLSKRLQKQYHRLFLVQISQFSQTSINREIQFWKKSQGECFSLVWIKYTGYKKSINETDAFPWSIQYM